MPYRCVLGCPPANIPHHRFPNRDKYPDKLKSWIEVVKKVKDGLDFDYAKHRICDIHFTQKHHVRNNRLSVLAVPSLFLKGNLYVEEEPSEPCEETSTLSEVSDSHQSTSGDLADVETHSEPCVPTRNISAVVVSDVRQFRSVKRWLPPEKFDASLKNALRKKFKVENKCVNKKEASSNTESKFGKRCADCVKFSNFSNNDCRNQNFSRLIHNKLQSIQPCMRRRAYARILNFLHTIRNYHSYEMGIKKKSKQG